MKSSNREVIRVEDGLITGFEPGPEPDTVLDAGGALACPGLIDSHAHVVFGDWTPAPGHPGLDRVLDARRSHLDDVGLRGPSARRPKDREG